MVGRKSFIAVIIVLSLSIAVLPAQGKAQPQPIGRSGELGLLFNCQNLLADILPYNDGFQSGIGVKYWPMENLALRGLLGLYYNSYTAPEDTIADTTTYLSLGAGAEYHPRSAKMSPYFGAFAGMKMNIISDVTATGYYAGVMAGAEYRIGNNLALFGEYQIRFSYDSKGTTVSIGNIEDTTNGAVIGIGLYF
jgi:hypothetical protein